MKIPAMLVLTCRISPRQSPLTALAFALLLSLAAGPAGMAQSTPPLNMMNNYFVTGDYVVGGVGLRGLGVNGYATGTIHIPDNTYSAYPGMNYSSGTTVPAGADIVAAFLYWQTVESSQSSSAGQQGFFNGYPITGVTLGNPNAPVSWSSGGCAGSSNGSKTIRTYRADVRGYLPVDPGGNIQPNGDYDVSLADSGSNGGGAPLTLGATLVIIYRVLPVVATVPLKAIVLYDGAYAPSNSSSTTSVTMQWIYQPAGSPQARLTHIAGNGQSNKYEQVFFNGNALTPPNMAAFPGAYNGSWDNPSWVVNPYMNSSITSDPGSPNETTTVVPSSSNSGCVSWSAVVLSTTVQDSDNDGLLDVWEQNHGYCDATYLVTGSCAPGTTSWVDLTGTTPGSRDLFLQVDYMCSGTLNSDGSCNPGTSGHSHLPSLAAQTALQNVFSAHGINLHLNVKNAILEESCTDDLTASPPRYCSYPGTAGAGAIGWKSGFEFLKYAALPSDTSTLCQTYGVCQRNFQYGRKDSYHYAVFGHSLALPDWSFGNGTLSSVSVNNTGLVTFTTSTSISKSFDRVTISNAISNPSLNGVFLTNAAEGASTFTIQLPSSPTSPATYTRLTDPALSVASNNLGKRSGFSDVGGADSLITLGQWGADGTTDSTVSGTFMHELGHSLTLTHGGLYRASADAAVPLSIGANCKPNYQSVMNYFFQVDLLGPNRVLDYSSQVLGSLDESSLPVSIGTTDGTAIAYTTTSWYDKAAPGGVGSPATRHCDGTALLSTDTSMYRVSGPTPPASPADTSLTIPLSSLSLDINFDGLPGTLNGFNDWANLDLRQIGATGSAFAGAGGVQLNSGGIQLNSGGVQLNSGGVQLNSGGIQLNSGGIQLNSGGVQLNSGGDIDYDTANSVVRSPSNLRSSLTSGSPYYVILNWTAPGFGQIASYNIYRGVNGTPAAPAYASVTGSPLATTYVDKNVVCGPTYTYFVTAVLTDGRESAASNSVTQKACAPPYIFTGFYSPLSPAGDSSNSGSFNIGKSVTAKWTLQDSSGNYLGNLNANTLVAVGPLPKVGGVCPLPKQVPVFMASTSYPYPAATLYSPTTGAKGNSIFRISSSNNQFIFNWDTTPFPAGCYVLELDLDSGQVERSALTLK